MGVTSYLTINMKTYLLRIPRFLRSHNVNGIDKRALANISSFNSSDNSISQSVNKIKSDASGGKVSMIPDSTCLDEQGLANWYGRNLKGVRKANKDETEQRYSTSDLHSTQGLNDAISIEDLEDIDQKHHIGNGQGNKDDKVLDY